MRNKESVFRKRKITYSAVLVSILALYLVSSLITEFKLSEGIMAFPEAMTWITSTLVPDAKAFERVPKIWNKLMETALLSVAVTTIAAVMAFIFSLFGSRTLKFHRLINQIVRTVAAFFRNVPDVVWAMLLMFSFGQNILTGFFALFFTTSDC